MKHGFDENRSQEVISTLTIILIALNNICFVIIGTKGKHNEKNSKNCDLFNNSQSIFRMA